MLLTTDVPDTQAAIRTDLGAIFVFLELSKSTWLVTSLSPGAGEKMSKHQVQGGDMIGLLNRFDQLRGKAQARTGTTFPLIVIQEAGLDGFWIDRALKNEGIESHVVQPKEEDRRRICRKRRALIAERILHVNRIKGLCFCQGIRGYEPSRQSEIANRVDTADMAKRAEQAFGPCGCVISPTALTKWFQDRVQRNGGRLRKPMIVALARKLLVALWKYVNGGVVIEDAVMSAA